MSDLFRLEIRGQEWLAPLPGGRYEDGSVDTCSHGSIYCEIGGTVVTTDEPEYGITQSALSLLRSIELDQPIDGDLTPIPSYLLAHGCGYPIGLGCDNFGTDWTVRHQGNEVILSDGLLISGRRTMRFDFSVRVPLDEYAREVVAFARIARRFYFSDGPRQSDVLEIHELFWAEFESRLHRADRLIRSEDASPPMASG